MEIYGSSVILTFSEHTGSSEPTRFHLFPEMQFLNGRFFSLEHYSEVYNQSFSLEKGSIMTVEQMKLSKIV